MCTIDKCGGVSPLIKWILILWSNLARLITLYSCKRNVTLKMAGLLAETCRWKYHNKNVTLELSAFCRFLAHAILTYPKLRLTLLHFTLSRTHLYNLFYTTHFIWHIKYNCTLSDWARGDAVVWATALQDRRLWARFPMGSLALGSTDPLTEIGTRGISCG